ncbi:geranylgeranyl diphosphate synthase type II [Salibacterium salarium]|uniref:polyprenyl synthetase family protein n=1 Tax=Salibacterium salarium TaxID=284579 RepID=UPI00277EB1DF|nr:farnesyl diphosphate synthase [Salibacterium salarium]MDQ0299575.1 geranylgeranyl diphosphate synthase type II [Salibacterium salarium]
MNSELKSFIDTHKDEIDQRLVQLFETMECPSKLKEAMLYSINAGGKRIRPLLMLAAIQSYRNINETDYDAVCAVEMVHTYSLIHDDLPAMDDDDYRRGKLTNHKVYGEAFAVLSGDALLTKAFETLSNLSNVNDLNKVKLIQEFAKDSGAEGMVGGQAADLEGEGKDLSLEELEYIHHHKTGALLNFSIVAGGILGGAPSDDIQQLRIFSQELGLVFQIKDDILDVEGNEVEMGKATGADQNKNKSTYPRLLTLEGAKEKLVYHADIAKSSLQTTSASSTLLENFVDYVMMRLN